MDHILFYKSFSFRSLSVKSGHHTDNSMGIPCHFIARMRQGSVRFVTLTGEEMSLHRGDVFYLPQGLKYHSYWESDSQSGSVIEWDSYSFTVFPNPDDLRYPMQKLTCDADALLHLDVIHQSLTVSPTSIGHLYLFLGCVLPQMREENPDPQAQLLARAKQYMIQNPDFKVGDLARYCGISESGLYALFQSYGGMTPVEMKHRLQIESAITLLTTTDRSVEEISARLGFHSAGYFRRIFKQQTGKTPSQVRKATENKII